MGCHYCNYNGGGHSPDCPMVVEDRKEKSFRLHQWGLGRDAGRAGKARPANASKQFILGWLRGIVALEESQNCSGW